MARARRQAPVAPGATKEGPGPGSRNGPGQGRPAARPVRPAPSPSALAYPNPDLPATGRSTACEVGRASGDAQQ